MFTPVLKRKQGFTLTEVIVVSLITGMLGVGLTSMMIWMFQSSKDGQSLAHLQDQGNTVLEDVAHKVRNSTDLITSIDQKKIVFFVGGVRKDSMMISSGTLYESNGAYTIAGKTVSLIQDKSTFTVSPDGNSARLDLMLSRGTQSFKVSSGYFRCRN